MPDSKQPVQSKTDYRKINLPKVDIITKTFSLNKDKIAKHEVTRVPELKQKRPIDSSAH